MKEFRHHPDGYIYINQNVFTLDLFKKLEPNYSLPEDYIGREYSNNGGIINRLYTENSETFLREEDGTGSLWEDGEEYIQKYGD